MIILNDLKYAGRLLAKKPGFTLLTTLVMATGITLSLFLFSFLNSMSFKALPFQDGESIVVLNSYLKGEVDYGEPIDLHDYYEIRNNVEGLSEFGAFRDVSVNAAGRDTVRRYNATKIEPNVFSITRTQPILGRGFTEAENRSGSENVVVIGYDIWQNQYNGNDDVIDKVMRINGNSHRIIGVMPQGYYFPTRAEMWLPTKEVATEMNRGDAGRYYGVTHIERGRSLQDIDNQLATIMQRLEGLYPETNTDISAYVATLQNSQGTRGSQNVIYVLYFVALLILLLASINVGNLLLSRAVERGRETAIRVALGAPRSRLISQMLWESIIICTTGGIIGLLLTAWGLSAMDSIVASFFVDKPVFWWKFGVDAFTLKLFFYFLIGTIIFTGLIPAWKNSGSDFNAILRDGTRGAQGKKAGRLNGILVISEIFLSKTILIIAAVIMVGTYKASVADYGADTKDILTASIMLPDADYSEPGVKAKFATTLQSRLENSAGIGRVMISSALPGQYSDRSAVAIEGKEYQEQGTGSYPRVNRIMSVSGSLQRLGVELRSGRYFDSGDNVLDGTTVIVSESFVSRYLDGESPLGKRLRFVDLDGDTPTWLTIVGVVEHTMHGAANEEIARSPSVIRPYHQSPVAEMTIAMEMVAEASIVTRTLRETLQSIDPQLPAFTIEPYSEAVSRTTAPMRFLSSLFLMFGVVAVLLAASGIYGVMSNTITQRTQETGVKRALGATDQLITKELMMTGIKQLLWGGILGLVVGCVMGFGMSSAMGIDTENLVVIAVVLSVFLSAVVLFATHTPTKRALAMEPAEALHYD